MASKKTNSQHLENLIAWIPAVWKDEVRSLLEAWSSTVHFFGCDEVTGSRIQINYSPYNQGVEQAICDLQGRLQTICRSCGCGSGRETPDWGIVCEVCEVKKGEGLGTFNTVVEMPPLGNLKPLPTASTMVYNEPMMVTVSNTSGYGGPTITFDPIHKTEHDAWMIEPVPTSKSNIFQKLYGSSMGEAESYKTTIGGHTTTLPFTEKLANEYKYWIGGGSWKTPEDTAFDIPLGEMDSSKPLKE